MTISAWYEAYRLMPNLQDHQLRVAGVAKVLIDHWSPPLDHATTEMIIQACLLHDMGNIIKFDLTRFPQFLEPQGLAYWQNVQNEFIQKYGADEHQASLHIAREMGVSSAVLQLIDAVSFSVTHNNFMSKNPAQMICAYADLRVGPHGVITLPARIADLELRYGAKYSLPQQVQQRQEHARFAHAIEKWLFEHTNLKPDDITEEIIQNETESLKKVEI